jgi:hypothetical protein
MRQEKAPRGKVRLFSTTTLQDSCVRSRITISKQLQPAMTNSVYTKPIKSRKQTALVSLKHCELSPGFVADLQDKNESKLLYKWDNTAYCPSAVMKSVDAHQNGQGQPSNLYISADERAVLISGEKK